MAISAPGRSRSNSESTGILSSFRYARSRTDTSTTGTSSVMPPSSYRLGGMRQLEDAAEYPNQTPFKSPEMSITINSPFVRSVRRSGEEHVSLPVFGDHDHIPGSITLDPQNCAAESGKLTLSIEGVFEYISPMSASKAGPSQIAPGKHRHVFFQDEAVIPLYTSSEPGPRSRPIIRTAIANIRRSASKERMIPPTLRKTRSVESGFGRDRSSSSASSSSSVSTSSSRSTSSSVSWSSVSSSSSAAPKTFNFSFELPKAERAGDELPPSFSSSNVVSAGVRGRVYAENADVRYRIRAVWEALDGSGAQAQLEAPFLFQPDMDFQSLDGFSMAPDSWSETSLSSVDGSSIQCAVTMPQPATFPRKSSIPYYVVFTTNPRSRSLAAEVMADATIAVSLVRRVGFYKPNPKPITGQGPPTPRVPLLSAPTPPSTEAVKEAVEVASKFHRSDSLTSSKSIGDLRSLRNKLRDAIPPVPRLDTSLSVTALRRKPNSQPSSPATPPTPPSKSDVSTPVTPTGLKDKSHTRIFRRVARSAPPVLSGFRFSRAGDVVDSDASSNPSSSVWRTPNKPLPTIPQEPESSRKTFEAKSTSRAGHRLSPSESNNVTSVVLSAQKDRYLVTDSRTLHTDVSVGFPKRPKGRSPVEGSHPSLETVSTLPDGLYKGSIPLQKGWFPSMQWDGLTIEYFLQVSVIFDNSVFKGQVPLRLF